MTPAYIRGCLVINFAHNHRRRFEENVHFFVITQTHVWISMASLHVATCRAHNFPPLPNGFEAAMPTAIGGGGLASAFKPPRRRLRQGPPLLAALRGTSSAANSTAGQISKHNHRGQLYSSASLAAAEPLPRGRTAYGGPCGPGATSAVGSPARPLATRPGGMVVVRVGYVVLAVVVVVTSSSGGSSISTIVPSRLFHFLNR